MKRQLWLMIACACIAATALAQPPADNNYAGTPAGAGAAGEPAPNAMFTAIDADGDGAITMRELRKAVVALKQLDLDKDGKITLAEVAGGPTQFNKAPTALRGTSRFDNAGGNVAGDPRPSGPNLLQYDRDGDGQLSPDEVPTQMMGLLRGGDKNNNGKLDPQELQLIQQRIHERVRGQQPLPPGVSVGPQGVTRTPQNP